MGQQVCAETAVVRLLTDDGWEAVCVSSNLYRRDFPPHRCTLSAEAEQQLHRIRGKKLTGCWDVFAFKNGASLFVECKRKSKDSIKQSQCEWLSEAIKLGLSPENFLILEWTTET